MNPIPAWFKALTLAERHQILSSSGRFYPLDNSPSDLARRRLQRWREQPQFAEDSLLAQRLAQDGLDEEKLLLLLDDPRAYVGAEFPPAPNWWTGLLEAYSRPARAYASPDPGQEELGFLELVQPLVDTACDRLQAGIAELADRWRELPFDRQTIEEILLMNLPDPLLLRLSRTMVLELNVARLEGALTGETPEARFWDFLELLRQPEISLAALEEYPVLARQLVTCINQWVEVSLEFLDRLCADWPSLREFFSPDEDPGLLLELTGGAGDTHRGGRSVMVARFESGFQLVYKPKSMAVDIHFQELLVWLNEHGQTPPLGTLQIQDCGDYGWVEFVQYEECASLAAVQRFYRRLGSYLALLYAINASDFHLENLISAGEHPLLIDLETLFNPEFERFDATEATLVAEKEMVQSVLVAGMLPQRLWSGDDYGGIDISGFGGEAGQLTPDRLPFATAAGTDEMRFIRERMELSAEANRPRLNGVEVNALDHTEDVIEGFRSMYRLLLTQREDLLAENGPLARFAGNETRVLLRPTRTYDQLLFESFHPDTLHDALDRDLLFDRLWLVVAGRPFMALAVPAEQAEMQQGDIPVFTTTPDSLILRSGSGAEISGILIETGLDLTRKRFERLSEADLRRQEWFIRSSLATLRPYEFGIDPHPEPPYRLLSAGAKMNRSRLLAAARLVADRLVETAVLGEENVSWLGLQMLTGGNWDISPVGMDLYNGIPGIALFLGYAGAILQEESYTTLARRAVAGMARHRELFGAELPGIGAFEGWGGALYTLTHLGVLWADSAVIAQAGEVVEVLTGYIDQDESFDILRGAAGAIGALLAFAPSDPNGKALAAAIACGDYLLTAAQETSPGLGWVIPTMGSRPLAGFANGAAGIAWALLELAGASGEKRFHAAAMQAIAYERSLFSPEMASWPDLRQSDRDIPEKNRFPVAWCHGAVGIGLARLRAMAYLSDPQLGGEIEAALQGTLAGGFGHSHCLCHGDLGSLDLLLEAARVLDEPGWGEQIDRLGAMILASGEDHGWFCGGPGGVELPGLMLGIAGIGYQLLRLVAPERVPSVLALAPPRREKAADLHPARLSGR